MHAVALVASLLVAGPAGAEPSAGSLIGIPPLAPDERIRLATAVDGRDHREEAFAALLEHAGRVAASPDAGPGSAAVRLAPDYPAMVADPEPFRGDLCRVRGTIQQMTPLPPPYESAREWFVRGESGPPVIVYVAGLDDAAAASFAPGHEVVIDARFYKRVEAVARDGRPRAYPAFVGAHPRRPRIPAESTGTAPLLPLVLAVGGLGVALLVARRLARRHPGRRPRPVPRRSPRDVATRPDEEPLPDDPVEALATLRRRAGVVGGDRPRTSPEGSCRPSP